MQEMNIFNTEERFETLSEMEMMDIQGGEQLVKTLSEVIRDYVFGIFGK